MRTFDYWWHLRTGQQIVETRSVPKQDIYTYTVEGNRWIDIHWLHQVGLHALYQLDGHRGVVLAKAALVALLVALLAGIGWRRERPWVAVLALGLMLVAAGDRFMPRPELPSFVLLAAILLLLHRDTLRRDRLVYAVVPLQLLWANLHGLFALGLAVCAIYAATEWLRPWIVPGSTRDRAAVRRLLAVLLLATAATLLNPNGLDGFLYPLEQLQMIGPAEDRGVFGMLIAELIPPVGGAMRIAAPVMASVGLLAALSFAAMALNWRRVPAADPLLWAAFGYLALGANRNLALFVIVAAAISMRNLNDFLDRHPLPRRVGAFASVLLFVALVGLCVEIARDRYFSRLGSMREAGLGTLDVFYPVGAAEWLAELAPPGPIFHHMADGGYLIWRLFPDYPVMVDGRLEVFGPKRFVELQAVSVEQFRGLDEEFGFGVALIHYSLIQSDALLWWLHLSPSWRLAYLDEISAVYVATEKAPRWIREIDVDDPEAFPPIEGEPGPSDLVRHMGRTNFLTAMRRWDRALAAWEETLERYPDLAQGPIVHASLLYKNGLTAAAETLLRRLLEEDPDDVKLLVQVGDLRLEAGDLEAARQLYDRALAENEDFPYAAFQRARVAEAEGERQEAMRLLTRVVALSPEGSALAVLATSAAERLAAAP